MAKDLRSSKTEDGVLKYQCTGCQEWKAVGEFHRLCHQLMEASRCKIRSKCKKCSNRERVEVRRKRRAAGQFVLDPIF
jgi:hypothetical protein